MLRWYRVLFYGTLALLVLVGILAFSYPLFGSVFPVVLFIWLGEYLPIYWKLLHWLCPHCGQPYFWRPDRVFLGYAIRNCAHCGLSWKDLT